MSASKNVEGRCRSGITGLDEILQGGIPRGGCILVAGGPGSGKTILSTQFLLKGIQKFDEPGLLVTFDETPDSIRKNMLSFGWDLAELEETKKLVQELNPQKRIYIDQSDPMTEAAIDVGFMRDVYSALGEPLGNGAWSMRLYHKPLIRWIWLGCLFMTIGGVLAVSDKRYRRSRVAQRKTQINVQVVVQS